MSFVISFKKISQTLSCFERLRQADGRAGRTFCYGKPSKENTLGKIELTCLLATHRRMTLNLPEKETKQSGVVSTQQKLHTLTAIEILSKYVVDVSGRSRNSYLGLKEYEFNIVNYS
jgi:hypothetical protein